MAFGARRIFPDDLNARKAIGVSIPFTGEAVFSSNYQTRDAIKNNLVNFLLTNPGERPGNPAFGAGLRRYIFSQITDGNLDFLKEDVQAKISSNFNNILLNSIQVLQIPDENTINIVITYSIPNTGNNDQLELSFS